jgi:hypothetical protein
MLCSHPELFVVRQAILVTEGIAYCETHSFKITQEESLLEKEESLLLNCVLVVIQANMPFHFRTLVYDLSKSLG